MSPGLAVTLPSPAPPPPLLLSSPDTNQASQTILFPAGRLAASFAPDGTFLACAFRHLLCLQRGLESRLGSGRNHAEDPQRHQPPSRGRDHHCVGAPGPPQGHMPSQPFPCLQTPEQWASGQSTSPPLRAQGVLVGGVRTDTISVCPQQEVDARTWPDLTGTSTTRAGGRHGGGEEHSGWGTRGRALAGPGSSVATPPPAGEGRVNPVGKGSAEPLCIPQTGSEWAASSRTEARLGPASLQRSLPSLPCHWSPLCAQTGQQSFKTKTKSLPSLRAIHCKSGGRSGDRTPPLPGPPCQSPRSIMPSPFPGPALVTSINDLKCPVVKFQASPFPG